MATERTVLIVEDSGEAATLLEIALARVPGLTTASARNGRQALEYLDGPEGAGVCAVFTDLNMPVVDGFGLIASLRRSEKHRTLPIIVLSADTDPKTPERVRTLGANAFFAKPFSPAAVRSKLEELLHA